MLISGYSAGAKETPRMSVLISSCEIGRDPISRNTKDLPFNPYDRDTFYTPGDQPAGYTDYPFAE